MQAYVLTKSFFIPQSLTSAQSSSFLCSHISNARKQALLEMCSPNPFDAVKQK